MSFRWRAKKVTSSAFIVLALFSLSIGTLAAFFPQKTYAAEDNDKLSISQQHARTLLYALERCVDKHLNSTPTASEVNAVDVFINQSSDGVSIGYEIDTDNGARQCNNLDYSKALGFIDMDASDIRNMYTCNNGACSLKDGSNDSLLTRMRQKMRERAHSGGRVYGPKERARRLAVTLSRCIEPLGDGLHPERGSLITIDGSRFQLRDGMSMKDKISAGIDMEPVDGKYECETLINLARNENVLDSLPDGVTLASLFSNPSAMSGDDGAAEGGEPVDVEPTCESSGAALSWILCPLIFLGDAVIRKLDQAIIALLNTPNDYFNDPSNGLQRAWSRLRNIAYIVLVPITLVMVIGTALGFDFVSAYTVKRAMPRLIIAAIFIALSYDITKFLVVLTNDVGNSIGGLITSAVASHGRIDLASIFSPSGADSATGIVGAVGIGLGVAAVGSIGILLSYILVAIVGLAIGFFLLSLRQVLIIALMILAPVAILAWIFPGNDKLWKLWWGTFSKLLLLFPLIMILIASGKAFAALLAGVPEVGTGADPNPISSNFVTTLLKLIAYVGPYFFIPAMFKFAGGIFATVSGMANDRSRGIFDRNRKYRQRKYGENWNDFKAGERKFRPRAFNEMGRRVGVGAGGRFGFGRRGQQALATQARNAAAERVAKDDSLKQLVLADDDAGAIMFGSGGTTAGARQAAEELYQMKIAGGASAAEARRDVDIAFDKAAAVGFTRSRAQAAGVLVMQNKARAIAGGEEGNAFVENAIHRLHGNNDEAAAEALDTVAYFARESGRSDLGAVAGARTDAQGARRSEDDILDDAFRRTGAAKVARGHTTSLQAHTQSIVRRHRAALASGDQAALFETGAQIAALRNSMGQDMSEDNKRILTSTFVAAGLDISRQESIDQQIGEQIEAASGGATSATEATEMLRDRVGLYDSGVLSGPGGMTPAQLAAWHAAQGGQGGNPGAPGGPAAAGGSDSRIKRNIKALGVTPTGIRLYQFQYLWSDQVYVGVMAQDLLQSIYSYAVFMSESGYYVVDYGALGLRMLTLDEWQANPKTIYLDSSRKTAA